MYCMALYFHHLTVSGVQQVLKILLNEVFQQIRGFS